MTSWTRLHCSLDPSHAPYWFSCRLASWHCTESLHTRFSLMTSSSADQYDLCILVSHHKIQMNIMTMILASTACTTLNKNNKLLITIYLLFSSKLSFSLSFWLTSSSVPEPICILTLSGYSPLYATSAIMPPKTANRTPIPRQAKKNHFPANSEPAPTPRALSLGPLKPLVKNHPVSQVRNRQRNHPLRTYLL